MPIVNLDTHPEQFVTVAELAEYWGVSRQQIHKRIGSGALAAIRLGSRLCRVRTEAAREFERQAIVLAGYSAGATQATSAPAQRVANQGEDAPKNRIQRVR